MDVVVGYVLPFVAFLAIFALLQRRAGDRALPARESARWIALILLCAGVAIAAGAVLD
jgi:hypothetical protein